MIRPDISERTMVGPSLETNMVAEQVNAPWTFNREEECPTTSARDIEARMIAIEMLIRELQTKIGSSSDKDETRINHSEKREGN